MSVVQVSPSPSTESTSSWQLDTSSAKNNHTGTTKASKADTVVRRLHVPTSAPHKKGARTPLAGVLRGMREEGASARDGSLISVAQRDMNTATPLGAWGPREDLPSESTERPHAPSGVAVFMSAHSKTPCITPCMDISSMGMG